MYTELFRKSEKIKSKYLGRRYEFLLHKTPHVIAHRGASAWAPENTIPSFELAVKQGSDFLELDLHLTADRHIVAIHDSTVNRTTNGQGAVSSLTLREIQRLDAGYYFTRDNGKTYPYRGKGIYVPSLEQVLKAFPNTPLVIEIKPKRTGMEKDLLDLLKRYDAYRHTVLASYYKQVLNRIRKGYSDSITSMSIGEVFTFYILHLFNLTHLYSHPSKVLQIPDHLGPIRIASGSFINDALSHQMIVHIWTVNEEDDMKRVLDTGVHGIITDYPDRAKKLIDRR